MPAVRETQRPEGWTAALLPGAQLISWAPLGVAVDHLISAEDVKRKGRVDEIMECPGKVQG